MLNDALLAADIGDRFCTVLFGTVRVRPGTATMVFSSGGHPEPVVVRASGEVELDFLTRAFRNTTPFVLDPDFAETPAGRDPLGASVSAFIDAVENRSPRPLVNGEEAARALDLAVRIDEAR